MNQEQFTKLINLTCEQTSDLLIRKGAEYASDADRLANFKNNAERLGMTPLQVWSVYAGKHIDGIQSYMKKIHGVGASEMSINLQVIDDKLSEPIEGRFHDLINYCYLGLAILHEIKNSPEVKQADGSDYVL